MFGNFQSMEIDTGEAGIFIRRAGNGPALLLLHGFPQTHLMWRDVAPELAERFTVICADLRGYGASACPSSFGPHRPKRSRTKCCCRSSSLPISCRTRFWRSIRAVKWR